MEVSQTYKQTTVKTICNDVALLTTADLLEVELAGHAQEDEQERRKQKNANAAYRLSIFYSKGDWQEQTQAFFVGASCDRYWLLQGGSVSLPASQSQSVDVYDAMGLRRHVVSDCKRAPSAIHLPITRARIALPLLLLLRLPHLINLRQRPRPRVIPRRRLIPKQQGKGKAKPQAKASANAASSSAQAHTAELLWAHAVMDDNDMSCH